MITFGFVPGYSDIVTVGQPFTINNLTFISAYICVTGSSGDIVYLNQHGNAQYFPAAQMGQCYLIGATQIVASAMVNGVMRTTTATAMSWSAVNTLNNAP